MCKSMKICIIVCHLHLQMSLYLFDIKIQLKWHQHFICHECFNIKKDTSIRFSEGISTLKDSLSMVQEDFNISKINSTITLFNNTTNPGSKKEPFIPR